MKSILFKVSKVRFLNPLEIVLRVKMVYSIFQPLQYKKTMLIHRANLISSKNFIFV